MKLKWWFKVNQNKLYKKYSFDPHGYIIRKAQKTKTFRFLLRNIKYTIFKKAFVYRMQRHKFRKKLQAAYLRKYFRYGEEKRYVKKSKIIKKLLKKWNYNFWNKFKNNYFNKSFSSLKEKKYSSFFFLSIYKKNTVSKYSKLHKIHTMLYKYRVKGIKRKVKRRINAKNTAKDKRRKLLKRIVWLRVIKYRKKKKSWWLLRVTNKKAAFFYGIVQLKKFRYINKLNSRNMPLASFFNYKLDSMLNIILFRLNIFDNIYIVNNFIRIGGIVLINNKKVVYPFRFVKFGDIISFKFSSFKKMFNIFYKRSKFNRSFILKKMLNEKISYMPNVRKLLKISKNFLNIPPYIEYNYKILHFIIWRLPHENEFLNLDYKYFNTYIWSFETQLQYN